MNPIATLLNLGLTDSAAMIPLDGAIAFTLRREVIQYPQFAWAVREIATLHQRWRMTKVAESLLIVGQSGSGKSTVLDFYLQNFPRVRHQDRTEIPVLKVLTPEGPTVKSLAEAILTAMHDPAASHGTTTVKTQRIIHLFRECGVQLLLLDEFHHFYDTHRIKEGVRVTDWLKNLLNASSIPIVLFGLPLAIVALNSNRQLRRRFASPHVLSEFRFQTSEEQREFRGVLAQMQGKLPVKNGIDISDPVVARRFYYATHGLIDYVVKLLDDAALHLGANSGAGLSLEVLAESFRRQIWRDAPDAMNPFTTKVKLRFLNKPREPFEAWDDPGKYTLSRRASAILGKKGEGHD